MLFELILRHNQKFFFYSLSRPCVLILNCTVLTVRSAAPQNALWRGPGSRFEPGTVVKSKVVAVLPPQRRVSGEYLVAPVIIISYALRVMHFFVGATQMIMFKKFN